MMNNGFKWIIRLKLIKLIQDAQRDEERYKRIFLNLIDFDHNSICDPEDE